MPTTVLNRPLLSVRSVAAKLSVSEKTIRRLIGAGDLPAVRVGAQLRIDPGELEHWVYREPPAAGGATSPVAGSSQKIGK